ncbi:hypothetical protein TRVL_09620 [Trypanosoma vivax]|nr:hypothetical protein TRVL_09620 [Trypanosoma vivax]
MCHTDTRSLFLARTHASAVPKAPLPNTAARLICVTPEIIVRALAKTPVTYPCRMLLLNLRGSEERGKRHIVRTGRPLAAPGSVAQARPWCSEHNTACSRWLCGMCAFAMPR